MLLAWPERDVILLRQQHLLCCSDKAAPPTETLFFPDSKTPPPRWLDLFDCLIYESYEQLTGYIFMNRVNKSHMCERVIAAGSMAKMKRRLM